jgi:hypothetical protein
LEDSWAKLGDRATDEEQVGVWRMVVGFANRFMTLESLGAEKGGATCVLPEGLVKYVENQRQVDSQIVFLKDAP